MRIVVEKLTEAAFAPFGRVLGQPDSTAPNLAGEMEDVWLGMSDLMGLGGNSQRAVTYLKICRQPAVYNTLERHLSCAEAFIPLEGESILMVAPPENLAPQANPDLNQARAFLLDGAKGVLLKPGAWHALPYPLTVVATYLVLVDENIVRDGDVYKRTTTPIEFAWKAGMNRPMIATGPKAALSAAATGDRP